MGHVTLKIYHYILIIFKSHRPSWSTEHQLHVGAKHVLKVFIHCETKAHNEVAVQRQFMIPLFNKYYI